MNQTRNPLSATTIGIGLILSWAYLPTFRELIQKWSTEDQYSHGFLVPIFAVYLWFRNRDKAVGDSRKWPILGYSLIVLAVACRVLAALLSFLTLDGLSFVICLTGIVMVLGGKDRLRVGWQSLLFLIFMIPLPYQLERMMGAELQRIATTLSTFLLQTLAQPAIAEGNTILIGEIPLGVVEACSGLRMMMTFLAFSVAAVMLMERHWTVKALVLLSAIPIALFTNILRITATGIAEVIVWKSANKEPLMKFIHDFNGWMMMPVGLAFLLLELWIFKYLILEPKVKGLAMQPA